MKNWYGTIMGFFSETSIDMSIWYDGTGCVLYSDFFKRVSIYDFEFLKFFIFEIDFLPLYVFVSGEILIGSQNLNSHHSFGMTYKIK